MASAIHESTKACDHESIKTAVKFWSEQALIQIRTTDVEVCLASPLIFLLVWSVLLPLQLGTRIGKWQRVSQNYRGNNAATSTYILTSTFEWEDIVPSKHLKYTPCYDGFQCARLDVALNWNAAGQDGGSRAAIAIVKLPSRILVTDERYGEVVITKPSGPGESGIHQVLSGGKHIQKILNVASPPNEHKSGKSFEILSFDTRSINNTTLHSKFFLDLFNQQAWLLKYPDYGLLWNSETVLGLEWARAKALDESCQRSEILPHLNTAQAVQDTVEIEERDREWREKESKNILSCSSCKNIDSGSIDAFGVTERTKRKQGEEITKNRGFSYGPFLGQTPRSHASKPRQTPND